MTIAQTEGVAVLTLRVVEAAANVARCERRGFNVVCISRGPGLCRTRRATDHPGADVAGDNVNRRICRCTACLVVPSETGGNVTVAAGQTLHHAAGLALRRPNTGRQAALDTLSSRHRQSRSFQSTRA